MERLDVLSERIKRFNEDREWDQFHSPSNLAKSISIEAGELLECFQWNAWDNMAGNVTLRDGSVVNVTNTISQHELRVLMTRGTKGLYLYACDKDLREALNKAIVLV